MEDQPLSPRGRPHEPLFTTRFFVMCGFNFTVFLAAFQIFPAAPFRILQLGGSTAAAGLFLGFLTYSSALSALVTGALADRFGKQPVLLTCSLALTALAVGYGLSRSVPALLGLALVQGVFWSALLAASSAYMTDFIPASRRAEGIGYWGLSNVAALMIAPSLGFALFAHGWLALCLVAAALNLLLALIAARLPEAAAATRPTPARQLGPALVEWRVLGVALTLFLCSFGYGGLTSFAALYAEASGVRPKSLYFSCLAASILLVRPLAGPLADRLPARRLLPPFLVCCALGLLVLALSAHRAAFVGSALLFGAGLGSLHPVLATHVLKHVGPHRRGAAFGAILAAFDTGIGSGSVLTGWLVHRYGYARAFGVAAALAALAVPYFLLVEDRLLRPSRTLPA